MLWNKGGKFREKTGGKLSRCLLRQRSFLFQVMTQHPVNMAASLGCHRFPGWFIAPDPPKDSPDYRNTEEPNITFAWCALSHLCIFIRSFLKCYGMTFFFYLKVATLFKKAYIVVFTLHDKRQNSAVSDALHSKSTNWCLSHNISHLYILPYFTVSIQTS